MINDRSSKALAALIGIGLTAAIALGQTAPTLEEEVRAIEGARVAETVTLGSLAAPGHLSVETSGARAVRDAMGRSIGYLLDRSAVTYTIDPADEPVVRHNLEQLRGVSAFEKGKPVRFEVTNLVWLTAAKSSEAQVEGAAGPESPILAAALNPKFFEPALELVATSRGGWKNSVFATADIGGGRSLYYYFDEETSEEQLYLSSPRSRQNEIKHREGYPQLETIDERPVGRTRRQPPSVSFEVSSIDAKIVEEPGELGRVGATIGYRFLRDSKGILNLSLIDDDLDVIKTNRVRRVQGRFLGVTDEKGTALAFVRRGRSLLVSLPTEAKRGSVIRLKFDYTTPLMRYSGNRYWRIGDDAWFPRGSFLAVNATWNVEVHALAPFTAFGTGKEIRRWEEAGHNAVQLAEPRLTWFPVVGAGLFFPYKIQDPKGREISVVSYAMSRKGGQEKLAKLFSGLVEAYESLYPTYPFRSLTVVEVNDWGFGQAPAAYINITQEAFNPLADITNQAYSKYANEIFAHEIAHGWWGHYFRLASRDDQWLQESFAEYSAALVLEATRKQGDMKRKSNGWRVDARDVRASIPIVSANRLAGESAPLIRQRLLYAKGPWVLHALRSEIGDPAFFTLLRSFLRSFDGKTATTEDLLGLLNFITKKDYRPWFDRYVYGSEFPELARK